METQLLAQELPQGWQDSDLMRVSILGFSRIIWENGIVAFYTDIVRENTLNDFFKSAETSDAVVGWGSTYWNIVLRPYDYNKILPSKINIDLKDLTHKNCGASKVLFSSIGDALNIKKLGVNGVEAIEFYRKGHWYELARFVIRDNNILNLYWNKIMTSKDGSALLVEDTDKKQVSIKLYKIKEEIEQKISHKTIECNIHED